VAADRDPDSFCTSARPSKRLGRFSRYPQRGVTGQISPSPPYRSPSGSATHGYLSSAWISAEPRGARFYESERRRHRCDSTVTMKAIYSRRSKSRASCEAHSAPDLQSVAGVASPPNHSKLPFADALR
jgi:hypothetical protein